MGGENKIMSAMYLDLPLLFAIIHHDHCCVAATLPWKHHQLVINGGGEGRGGEEGLAEEERKR